MKVTHAGHQMRHQHNANASALQLALDARCGASALAQEKHVRVLRNSNRYVLDAQESPAMRVVVMGVNSQTYNFP